MLSLKEKMQIDEMLRHHPDRRSACVEAMQIVQKHQGWVSDENLRELGNQLGMTTHELDSIATFYSFIFRKPVGKHVVLVCDSISCFITGQALLLSHLTDRLGVRPGETTRDGRFTLLTVPCLGACVRAPAMMVDEDLYGELNPEKVGSILEDYD
jgi:NADH-quinone oxidoreductase subunit E